LKKVDLGIKHQAPKTGNLLRFPWFCSCSWKD